MSDQGPQPRRDPLHLLAGLPARLLELLVPERLRRLRRHVPADVHLLREQAQVVHVAQQADGSDAAAVKERARHAARTAVAHATVLLDEGSKPDQVRVAPLGEESCRLPDLWIAPVAGAHRQERAGKLLLGFDEKAEASAEQDHDRFPIFRILAAAYLKEGCLLTGSQLVSVSSFAPWSP